MASMFLCSAFPIRFSLLRRRCRALLSGWLILALIFLFPGAAWAENVVYDGSGFRTDTPIPEHATNSGGGNSYGLSDPGKVWKPEDGFSNPWPIGSNEQGYPTASLFPWSSGSDNTVTVDGRTLSTSGNAGYVLGGLWQDEGAHRNRVYIYNARINKVYGGGALGSVSYNEVYLGAGVRAEQATGALSAGVNSGTGQGSGTVVSHNRVFITDNARVDGIVSGGWNASGDSGAGTSSSDSPVFINSVRVEGNADLRGNVYGGYNEGNSHTYGNSVVIAGGTITGSDASQIAGGYSSVFGSTGTTAVYGNTVTITGGSIDLGSSSPYSGVYGGRSQGSAANSRVEVFNNTVNVAGGIVSRGTVTGGSGGQAGSASSTAASYVHHNAVNISGGSVASAAGGRANDGGTAEYNEVSLTGGTVTGDIYGAFDYAEDARDAVIQNNRVNLYGGTAANVHGGRSAGGANTGNTVALAGARVTGDIYAGYNLGAENQLVTDNAVTLLGGGAVEGFVYGTNYGITALTNTAWQGHGNRLDVLGGLTDAGGVGNFQTTAINAGAALNITGTDSADTTIDTNLDPVAVTYAKAAGAAVFHDLANNGRLSFYNGAANQDIAHITGAYSGGGALGLDVLVSPDATLTSGDSVIFDRTPSAPVVLEIQRLPGGRAAPYTPVTRIAEFRDGGTPVLRTTEHGYGIYAYDIRRDAGNNYLLGLTDEHAGDIGGHYSDGSGTGLTQVAVVSESFVRDNLENAVIATDGGGFGIAADMGYSRQRFNTANHVDLEGLTAFVTLSYHRQGTPFAVGVFADTFQGNYSTRNHVSLPAGDFAIKSRGELESYGGGVSFQYREKLDEAIESGSFAAWTPGPYLKALARAGYSRMDFETDDTVHPSSFDVGGLYYGASLGGGLVFDLSPRLVVDMYGYGAWTAMAERDATDSLGQHIDFAQADSLRLISGFRAAWKATENILPYAGLAAEWETLGRPEAHVDGYKADTADFSGVSGLIDLGVNGRIGDSVFLDLRASGSVGQREGIGGMLEIRYTF